MDAYEILKARGFIQQETEGVAEHLRKGRVTVYAGFDPTGPSPHVGHLVPVMALAHLQRAGHRVIALVGGATAMVGDPTGKDKARQILTVEQIEANKACWKQQLGHFLDFSGDALMVDNADWLLGLQYITFLRDVGQHLSMNTMLGKTSVKIRLEKGLSFLEFNYQILQAYDFLELNRRHGCDLQIGGDDQWGNITAGVELLRRMDGKGVHAMTFPLITTASGAKMGKTEGGAVWLDPTYRPTEDSKPVTPYDYYQYWINVDDADVGRFLRFFTFLPLDEIARLEALEGADIREAKRVLAYEATREVHGAEAADAAAKGQVSDEMPEHLTALPEKLLVVLADAQLCKSRGDARRQIQGGAVRMGADRSQKVDDVDAVLTPEQVGEGLVVWVGRKKAIRVRGQ
jgi:tyrosyl-tRNA synthetase